MTTHTWIYIGAGLAMGTVALTSLFRLRKMREKLTRQSLPMFLGLCVSWALFGVFTFSGVLSIIYFATIAVIHVPTIVWLLKLPKDDHVA